MIYVIGLPLAILLTNGYATAQALSVIFCEKAYFEQVEQVREQVEETNLLTF